MTVAPARSLPGNRRRSVSSIPSTHPPRPLDALAYDRLVDAAESWWRSPVRNKDRTPVLDHLSGVALTGLRAHLPGAGRGTRDGWML